MKIYRVIDKNNRRNVSYFTNLADVIAEYEYQIKVFPGSIYIEMYDLSESQIIRGVKDNPALAYELLIGSRIKDKLKPIQILRY